MPQSYKTQRAQFWAEFSNPGWDEAWWDWVVDHPDGDPSQKTFDEAMAEQRRLDAETKAAEAKAAELKATELKAAERAEWEAMQKEFKRKEQERQEERDRVKAKAAWAACGVGAKYLGCTFENFRTVTEGQKKALEICQGFPYSEDRDIDAQNLWLLGSVGSGKTHLAVAVLRSEFPDYVDSVAFITQRNLILEIRASWNGDRSKGSSREVIEKYGSVDMLVLDDVGASYNGESEKNDILAVIDMRSQNGLATIITSNLTAAGIKQALGERSYSRLRMNAVLATLKEVDARVHGVPDVQTKTETVAD